MMLANIIKTARSSVVRPLATASAARAKHTLPDLPYDYNALEPVISSKIMTLHHTKHHQTYVNGLNDAEAKFSQALKESSPKDQVALTKLINFHGGGHINHTLFWENLAPKSQDGGVRPSNDSALGKAISRDFGSIDALIKQFNTASAGLQGSGWTWLGVNQTNKAVEIVTTANQDPLLSHIPLIGVDIWEHAYYLDYENRKAEYFEKIWDVINWKKAEERFGKV